MAPKSRLRISAGILKILSATRIADSRAFKFQGNSNMAEKDDVFSSEIKFVGNFNFKDFYQFCYEWIDNEIGIGVSETKYEEKIKGDEKEIQIEWEGDKKFTDYFKFEIKVKFTLRYLKDIEVNVGGKKVRMNNGEVKMKVKGTLIRDYAGKFESSGFSKFMRSVYEKWVITSRIDQFEDKIIDDCNDLIGQAKAYLDLEARK